MHYFGTVRKERTGKNMPKRYFITDQYLDAGVMLCVVSLMPIRDRLNRSAS